MNQWLAVGVLVLTGLAPAQVAAPPKAGKVDIFRLKDVKPGLQATAWTVFKGMEAEPVPVEIIGVWKNAIGPNQDVILGKMGGKAKETNVAGGMSGSPVYIDGRRVGAVALRLSVFSPDAICGITPIERMLEINDIDQSRPPDARTPDKAPAARAVAAEIPGDLLSRLVSAGSAAGTGSSLPSHLPLMTPIETPL